MKISTHSNNPHNISKIQLHNSTSIILELETMANANTTLQMEAYGSLWKLWCMLLLSPIVCKNFKSFLVRAGICLQKNRNKKFSSSIFCHYSGPLASQSEVIQLKPLIANPIVGFFCSLQKAHDLLYLNSKMAKEQRPVND